MEQGPADALAQVGHRLITDDAACGTDQFEAGYLDEVIPLQQVGVAAVHPAGDGISEAQVGKNQLIALLELGIGGFHGRECGKPDPSRCPAGGWPGHRQVLASVLACCQRTPNPIQQQKGVGTERGEGLCSRRWTSHQDQQRHVQLRLTHAGASLKEHQCRRSQPAGRSHRVFSSTCWL